MDPGAYNTDSSEMGDAVPGVIMSQLTDQQRERYYEFLIRNNVRFIRGIAQIEAPPSLTIL